MSNHTHQSRAFRLIVISGREYLLADVLQTVVAYEIREGERRIIGRGGSADIRFAGHDSSSNLSIARRQADLEVTDGIARLLDYGSARGDKFQRTVTINGEPVSGDGTQWVPLRPGDEIRIGDTVFKLEDMGEK